MGRRVTTLTPMKLAALNLIIATLLGITIERGEWWWVILFALLALWGWSLSNPKYWVTLPKKDYYEGVNDE